MSTSCAGSLRVPTPGHPTPVAAPSSAAPCNLAIVPARRTPPRRDGGVNSHRIHRTGSGTMATALVIEEESGTCTGFVHPHNGYYAGEFHRTDVGSVPTPAFAGVAEHVGAGATVLRMATGVFHEQTQQRAA